MLHRERAVTAELTFLLIRCAQRDRAAFRRLYDLYADPLYSAALGIVRTPSLAADVLHEVLMQVWHNADRFDAKRGNPRAWLLSIARYRALDAVNRFGRPTEDIDPETVVDQQMNPLERLEATEAGQALHRCLQQIDAERRQVVILAYGRGITQAQLATRFGKPLGTVKSMLRRALAELRSCLGGRP